MSSKRPRHALSDGRASPEVEQVKIQIPPEVANQLVAEFELYLQRLPPGESEQRIACLFAAKDPQRYAELKGEWGRACSKGAWSNIADVKWVHCRPRPLSQPSLLTMLLLEIISSDRTAPSTAAFIVARDSTAETTSSRTNARHMKRKNAIGTHPSHSSSQGI